MNFEQKEILIGTVAISMLMGVLWSINYFQSVNSKIPIAQKRIIAKFNKVDGLSEGSPVRMGGVRVGLVRKMRLDNQFRAIITMDVDSHYPYPTDTSATIHTDGLFGSKFIVLEPGAEENTLNSGDEILLTQDSLVVSDLLELIISEGKVAKGKHSNSKKRSNE